MPEVKTLTVSELTKYIKELFNSVPLFQGITIEGEISNFVYNQSGHIYFTLKDEQAQISCVMFKSYVDSLTFIPKDGDKVYLKGTVQVYEKSGRYQFYTTSIKEKGLGDLFLKFEELKKKLEKEGLFDQARKKAFPKFPKNIALLTSKTGAVIEDLKSIILARSNFSDLTLYPTKVQGEDAKYSIIENIKKANDDDSIDCIILARGGGSIEDLWPFNEEEVAYAIYNSKKPIMSAVGHETDFTIADFVADMRAATPSDAALRIVRDNKDLSVELNNLYIRLKQSTENKLKESYLRFDSIKQNKVFTNPQSILNKYTNDLMMLSSNLDRLSPKETLNKLKEKYNNLLLRLNHSYKNNLNEIKSDYLVINEKLVLLNPLGILDKGYSITYKDEEIIKDINNIKTSDIIKTRVKNGIIISSVTEVKNG